MKKQIFLIMLTCSVAKGFGQVVTDFSYPSYVDLFGLYEISFRLSPSYSNPYDPDTINIYAIFTDANNNSYTVNAFYYEEYTFQQINGYEEASHNASNDISWAGTVSGTMEDQPENVCPVQVTSGGIICSP